MSKFYLAGFIVATGIGVGTVDYINQARVSGLAPGAFPVSDYVGTIPGRFFAAKTAAAAEARREELLAMTIRDLLPDAPEGWTRRNWDAEAEALLDQRYDLAKDDFLPDEIKNDPMMAMLSNMEKNRSARADAEEVYVYAKDEELVSLRLRRRVADPQGGLAGAAMQMAAANLNGMTSTNGYAMVGGVAYRDQQGLYGTEQSGRSYRVITGKVGEELTIMVRSRASDEAIMSLLSAIDYDRLNASLEHPALGISNDAPVLDAEASRAMAEAQIRTEDEALKQAGSDAEARLKSLGGKLHDNAAAAPAGEVTIGTEDGDSAGLSQPSEKAGLFAMLTGMFTGGGNPEPEVTSPSEGGSTEVKVNKSIGSKNCASDRGFKRCSIGGS